MNAYEQLLSSIDAFIRKYYKNRMIRGFILFGTFILLLFLFIITLEYFGRFSSTVRLTLLLFFIFGGISLLTYYVVIPIAKLFSFGKIIGREQASKIIGDFFPDIQDKLLNTLQLGSQLDTSNQNFNLLQASINKRSKNLSVFDFKQVINFNYNLKFLKYLAVPVLILLFFLIYDPSFIKDSSQRVISYNQTFKKPRDFNFYIDNLPESISEGDDLNVSVSIKGKKLPENCFIHTSQGAYLMEKTGKNQFSYDFNKVGKNLKFYFSANDENSSTYKVAVIPNAVIGQFNAKIKYPAYLDKKDEEIKNAADITIPEGSVVEWSVISSNTRAIQLAFIDTVLAFTKSNFIFKKRFLNSSPLKVFLTNNTNNQEDTLNYTVSVIKDAFPTIAVKQEMDSISNAIRFFQGSLQDDYGLTSLYFVYTVKSKNGQSRTKKLPVSSPSGTSYSFNYAYDFRRDSLKTEDEIDYYFIVYDNDGVNGHKFSKSQTFKYNLPSKDELNEKRNDALNDAKDNIQKLMEQANKFQKNSQTLKNETLYNKSNPWELQNKLSDLQQQQQNLQDQLQELQNKLQESLDEKQSLDALDPELKEKYDLLQELLDKVMDDEMKKMLQELQDLLKDNKKNVFDQKMDNFDAQSKNLNEKLERTMELLKRTQVNEMMDDLKKSLDELSKDQFDLKNKEEAKQISKEDAVKEQSKIEDQFKQLKDDYNQLKDLNKELKSPYDLNQMDKLSNDISDDLKNAQKQLNSNQNKKAQESQQSASDKMKEMSDGLDAMQQQAQQDQNSEDMHLIRAILKDLISSSIEQEMFINEIDKVNVNDPYFTQLARNQNNLIIKSKPILDSLKKIAMRQPQISSFIDKEMEVLKNSQKLAMQGYGDRIKGNISIHSQFIMTSYNNLALLLNESLQQLQQQMQQQGMKGGSCDKPGSGKPGKEGQGQGQGQGQGTDGFNDMKDMLKKQIEQMKKAMGEGDNPGGKKDGKGNGQGQQGQGQGQTPGSKGLPGEGGVSNSELAKMIAEQRLLRQQLEQLRQMLNKDGKGTGNQLNSLIDELDKQERDLLNKRLGREQYQRQQDILTRLLESEKALKERGFEDKRESKVGKSYENRNQNRIDEYNKKKLNQLELFRSVDPIYNKYYKDKASEYFNKQY